MAAVPEVRAAGLARRGNQLVRIALVLALASACLCGCSTASSVADPDAVAEVLSGDSLRLGDGRVVRYAGVDAPKPAAPRAIEALESNRRLAENGQVRILVEEEREGTITAHVYLRTVVYGEEKFVYLNAEQLLRGWGAFAAIQNARRPDLMASLKEMEGHARASRRGIWADPPAK